MVDGKQWGNLNKLSPVRKLFNWLEHARKTWKENINRWETPGNILCELRMSGNQGKGSLNRKIEILGDNAKIYDLQSHMLPKCNLIWVVATSPTTPITIQLSPSLLVNPLLSWLGIQLCPLTDMDLPRASQERWPLRTWTLGSEGHKNLGINNLASSFAGRLVLWASEPRETINWAWEDYINRYLRWIHLGSFSQK